MCDICELPEASQSLPRFPSLYGAVLDTGMAAHFISQGKSLLGDLTQPLSFGTCETLVYVKTGYFVSMVLFDGRFGWFGFSKE